ncbi:MAG TPA: UDP-glucose--hexose-1-phosphate uridylyltransferase [Methylomirabilota bacterium]|nr:UDP-glucose--hexose-1-phosphate uridylyltransferase [Methylomirabilota bacterium]
MPDLERPAMRLLTEPHRRYDPLSDQWILVSANRNQRPWQGGVEGTPRDERPSYDPSCYLCPGNGRAGGATNPPYTGTFVFDNDFAALRPDTPPDRAEDGLLVAETEAGTCRVLCYDPRHDLTMARMEPAAVRSVIDLWADQTTELGERYRWVQVFENRGEAMGASNPHPHGQIWAGTALPRDGAREAATQRRHLERTGRPLLADYVSQESGGPRVVVENDAWLIVVPFWAGWPFEALILPQLDAARLADVPDHARDALATALIELLVRYDNLFDVDFPYSLGWHQAPFGEAEGDDPSGWLLHGHVYPPLLRSATVRKFMVGYELLAETQRDLTPEDAAARLRALPATRTRPTSPG